MSSSPGPGSGIARATRRSGPPTAPSSIAHISVIERRPFGDIIISPSLKLLRDNDEGCVIRIGLHREARVPFHFNRLLVQPAFDCLQRAAATRLRIVCGEVEK